MADKIEGIWKNGKIIPLMEMDLEENTKVTITVLDKEKNKESLMDLAGIWKSDNETYEVFKGVFKERKNFQLRKCPSA